METSSVLNTTLAISLDAAAGAMLRWTLSMLMNALFPLAAAAVAPHRGGSLSMTLLGMASISLLRSPSTTRRR